MSEKIPHNQKTRIKDLNLKIEEIQAKLTAIVTYLGADFIYGKKPSGEE